MAPAVALHAKFEGIRRSLEHLNPPSTATGRNSGLGPVSRLSVYRPSRSAITFSSLSASTEMGGLCQHDFCHGRSRVFGGGARSLCTAAENVGSLVPSF